MTLRRLLAAALITTACGGSPPTPAPIPPPAPIPVAAPAAPPAANPDDAPIPLWPEVRHGTLANGLQYYILKHGKPAKRARLWLAVNAGSLMEDADQRGLAHFDEHMAFNGTKRFPKDAIVKYLESVGMSFGADVNASTDWDETMYQLEVPTDAPSYLDKGLDILHDWAHGDVTYDPHEVDSERGVVLEEWRLGRGAGTRVFDKQSQVLFKGSRYADRIPIGLPEIIKGAPRDALVRFYKDWYRPDLMAVIAVGDFDPAQVEAAIQARFGDLQNPPNERPRIRGEVPTADGTRVSIETDKELPGANVTVTNTLAHRPEASKNDLRRAMVEQVYNGILNERLATITRRADAPFVAAFGGASGLVREIDAFQRIAQVKGARVEDALRALFTEVLRIERHGVTAGELARARANLKRLFEEGAVVEATSDSSEFTEEITRYFFAHELMVGRAVERDLSLAALDTVTLDDLNQVAKSFGGADNRTIMISGPVSMKLPTKERVLAIVDEVTKSDIPPWTDAAAVAGATLMTTPPTPGKIVAEKTIPAIGVTEWTLSNGARVVVKPTDFEADALAIEGSEPGGLATVKDADYQSAQFATTVVGAGGVGDLDAETLGKVLAGKAASAGPVMSETSDGMAGGGSVRDAEILFQLLYLRFTAPRRDAQAFGVWKANVTEQIANQRRIPEAQFAIERTALLYHHNLRRSFPSVDDIAMVDLDKALAFYKSRFADVSGFTFVIVGDIKLETLRPLVETYLASLPGDPKHPRKEVERDLKIRKIGGVVTKTWSLGQEPKAAVQIDFHGDEKWSRDKDRDVFILGQVLSIRLREVLRESLGGVYGVSAGGDIERRPHEERSFEIEFGCAPENVDKLIKATYDEIAAIAKNGIGEDYLGKIRASFTRERETLLRSNETWVQWLAHSYRFGDDPTLILDPSKLLARITSDHVKAAAKLFLDGRQVFQTVLLPAAAPASAPAVRP